MATFNYYLREPKSDKKTPIVLFVTGEGNTRKIKTQQSIEPKYWDFKKQQVKQAFTGSVELNTFLTAYKLKAQKAYSQSLSESVSPSAQYLRDKVEISSAPKKQMIDHFQAYKDAMSSTREANTVKKIVSTINHLKNFQESQAAFRSFDTINQIFYDQFLEYLNKQAGLNNNTAYKYIRVLKTFLQWSFDRELTNNTAFRRFKTKEFPVDVIHLNESELFTICNLDLSFNKTLALVRDAFCFGCFTGQRFSDIHTINWQDIKGNTWTLHTKKTKEQIEVPLNSYALSILKKYKDSPTPLHHLSNQKTNQYLKEIAKKAELNESIKIVDYIGNKKIERLFQKHELITTHVARKTFVTLSLEKGMRPETVMEITGHKDFRTLKRYIKITSKVKEGEMNKIWNQSVA